MSRTFPHLSFRKRFLLLLLLLIFTICTILYFAGFPLTQERRFSAFTKKVFCSELEGNTLNLHYTVANPENYGIDPGEVSLGSSDLQSRMNSLSACENYRTALLTFDREALSISGQQTYDILLDHLNTELSASDLILYDEPLSASLGIQAQLPILLAEYPLRTRQDVEDYLTLLTQLPDYFASIIDFEQHKSAAGLFMSKKSALAVIRQCSDFIKDPESNYLISIFKDKINRFTNLTTDEKIAYIDRCQKSVLTYVIPAYQDLIDGLRPLIGSGKNELGLSYLPKGKTYYEYLIHKMTGDKRSIKEIEEAIKQQMTADFTSAQKLTGEDSASADEAKLPANETDPKADETKLSADETDPKADETKLSADETGSKAGGTQKFAASASAVKADIRCSAQLMQETCLTRLNDDPVSMLKDLRQKIAQDFPASPSVSCAVRQVHPSLQDYLSPAFYLTPAIDSYLNNVIYINPAEHYQGLELYTTLAHEGYPGHLYQSVYFQSLSPDPLRCILETGGYTEGWATYVEMYSYGLWTQDPKAAALAQKNRAFTLGLASLLDIGIHYHGYSPEEITAFLKQLGITDRTAQSLYQNILQSPGNYLQYYVGWLNFQSLREKARARMGDAFTLKAFHEAVLKAGPAPFDLLEKYVIKELQEMKDR